MTANHDEIFLTHVILRKENVSLEEQNICKELQSRTQISFMYGTQEQGNENNGECAKLSH